MAISASFETSHMKPSAPGSDRIRSFASCSSRSLPFRQTGAGGYIRQDSNATIAKETGGNLASIKTDVDKIPSLGQALAAASTPVVLPAAQITTLTPPAAITNYALETGGNLATLAGGVTSSVYQENVKQVGGAAIGAAATPGDATAGLNAAPIFNFGMLFNGSSYDRLREAVNALNSTGTVLPAAQIVGQFDDTSPTAITENQFGNLRMSANRNLYGTIRDAAGNERGANVDANNNLQVSQPTAANFNATVLGGLADNGAAAGTNREAALPGIYQNNYLNGTAATQGRNAAESVGTDGLLWTANLPALRPASYHASGQVASAATATDIATMAGNATNTVVITKIQVSCTQTTAGIVTLSVLKRSSADTAGTSAAMTVVPDDSNYAAGSSAPKVWTANPTKGTLVGTIDTYKLGCMAAATASPNDVYILNLRQKPIVLRGTAQEVEINLGAPVDGTGTTVTGGSFDATFEWIETTTITP